MSVNQIFGRVRAIAHGEASAENWRALIALLDRAWLLDPKTVESVWLDALQEQLSAWPLYVMVPPRGWLRNLLAKRHEPRLVLARRPCLDSDLFEVLSHEGDIETYKVRGLRTLLDLAQHQGYGWSKDKQIVWLCGLLDSFVDAFYQKYFDVYEHNTLNHEMLEGVSLHEPEALEAALKLLSHNQSLRNCTLVRDDATYCINTVREFLTNTVMSYIDDDGGTLSIVSSSVEAQKVLLDELVQVWSSSAELALGSPPEGCFWVEREPMFHWERLERGFVIVAADRAIYFCTDVVDDGRVATEPSLDPMQ